MSDLEKDRPKHEPMVVSIAEQAHQADQLRASYELAIYRHHLRRVAR